MSKNEPPVVLCDVHPPKRAGEAEVWSFWCPYCRKVHTHGDGAAAGGHRVAHCWKPDSPYLATGYILKRKDAGRAFMPHETGQSGCKSGV